MGDVRRRWRDYKSAAGQRPVKKFLMGLPDEHRAAVADAMREVVRRASATAVPGTCAGASGKSASTRAS
ncbi:MAG: hypothetical protein ACRDK0_15675 [Solirubrobacteraceae bacterium]